MTNGKDVAVFSTIGWELSVLSKGSITSVIQVAVVRLLCGFTSIRREIESASSPSVAVASNDHLSDTLT